MNRGLGIEHSDGGGGGVFNKNKSSKRGAEHVRTRDNGRGKKGTRFFKRRLARGHS